MTMQQFIDLERASRKTPSEWREFMKIEILAEKIVNLEEQIKAHADQSLLIERMKKSQRDAYDELGRVCQENDELRLRLRKYEQKGIFSRIFGLD